VTSVANEAGFTIYDNFPDPLPEDTFFPICQATFLSTERTNIIVSSSFYPPVPSDGFVDARVQLQTLGTDYIWRCSAWTFARNWVKHGGTAYVGKYLLGATYPGNEAVPYCTQPGIVCHQDDIMIVVSHPLLLSASFNQSFLLVWDRAESHKSTIFFDR
jgi:hypothetical protein